jgi:hypothetical protein
VRLEAEASPRSNHTLYQHMDVRHTT